MPRFDFRVLGPLEVRREGELVVIPAPKQRALLGLLLLHANEPMHPEDLIDQLWGDGAPRTARASLQNLVHALRKRLGPDRLVREDGAYVLLAEANELDLDRFHRLVGDARTAEPRERAARLREALSLWRGAPLVELPEEPFVQHEIARIEEQRLSALEDCIDVELELGSRDDLIPELELLVDRYPLRERLWGQLMVALYRIGHQSDALATYGRARSVLVGELGVEPGEDLRALQRAILTQDPRLDNPEHRPGWTLERAAAILPLQPHDRAESLYEYGLALMRTGETRRAISTFEAAARIAAEQGERAVEKRARLYLSYLSVWLDGASLLEHLAEAQRAGRWFEECHDAKGLVTALRHQYQFLGMSGRADEGAELARYAVDVAAESGETWLRDGCLMERAWLVACGSKPVHEAIGECEELIEHTPDGSGHVGSPPLHLWAALGVLYAQAGRIDEGRALGERAVAEARKENRLPLLASAFGWRSEAELVVGNVADALQHASSACAINEIENGRLSMALCSAELACLLALDGDLVRARELALFARARASPDLFLIEVNWRRALALVAARQGHAAEAITLSDEARSRANSADLLSFRGQILEEAAIVRRLAADEAAETAALEESLALYEQKGNLVGAERVRSRLRRSGEAPGAESPG